MRWRWDLADGRHLGAAWILSAALVAFGLLLGGVSEISHRRQEARDASTQAELMATSLPAALAFDDRPSLREYVDALRLNPKVAAAAVYDSEGRVLVNFQRRPEWRPPVAALAPGIRRQDGSLQVSRAVEEQGVHLGAVFVASRPESLADLTARHGGLALLTLVAYVLLAVLSRAGLQLRGRADELAHANAQLKVEMSERARAEDALRQSQKMEALGQLTGGIAHDFNNLLQVVHGAFELIVRRADQPERVKLYAANGLQATERGASLTRQLLAFSRSQKLELKAFPISDLIHGMRQILVRTLGPDVSLRLDLERGQAAVLSDRTQLELAVLNLAINARDAMPDGGELTIAAQTRVVGPHPVLKPGEYVELSVTDSGQGMSPEVAARAFDPFFTTKGVGKGTGLGLSQVYGVAREAGGEAHIDSAPGGGARVVMILPRAEAPAVDPAPLERIGAAAAAHIDATLLVVDDDDDVRRLVCDSLDVLGYRTLEACGGAAALALLEQETPALALLDYAMPGMNGAEAATLIRRRHPGLPIIFASGYAETAAIQRAIGPDAVILRKPFEMNELARIVREALAGAAISVGRTGPAERPAPARPGPAPGPGSHP